MKIMLLLTLTFLFTSCGTKTSVDEELDSNDLSFTVTTVVDDPIPTQSKTWNWSCNIASSGNCEYRYVINTNPTHTFTVEPYSPAPTTDTQASGDAVYYLHSQVFDDFTLIESEVVTVSAILDNTAPSEPTGGAIASTFTANPAQSPTVTWVASTDTNGVDHYEVALGTSAGASDTVGWTDVGLLLTHQFTGLALTDGTQYFATVRAHDQATNVSTFHQNFGDFCSDTTIPVDPSNLNLVGQAYLTNSPQLTWNATTDACSGVQYYEVALGTTAGGNEVITWTNVGTNLNHQFITIVPELNVGVNYYLNVRATDNVGITGNAISSIAWQIPAAVNITGVVNDPTPTQTKTWNWACDNAPCDFRHVIDTTPTYNFNGEVWGLTTTDSQLTGDGTYYLHVQAKTQSNSDVSPTLNLSVIIDNTAPTNPSATALALPYTTNNAQSPVVSWTTSTDTNGVFDYEIGIGTTAGAVDTMAFTSDGNDLSATATGLTLIEGQNYFATIRTLDEAGNISGADNSTAFCYDNTAPTVPGTFAISTESTLLTTSPTHTWVASTDACSTVDHYEMSIGTTPGGQETQAWSDVGNVTTFQITGQTLSLGTTYYTSIRAHDVAGLISNVVDSVAWTVEIPYVLSVTPPANNTYNIGDNLDFIVNFDLNVTVANTPRIPITLTSGTVYADYNSGSGGTAITFRYTVGSSDDDINGIVLVSPLDLNGAGTIQSGASTNAQLTYAPPATGAILIDGVEPTITSITPPANTSYIPTQNLDFIANFSENVNVTGTPRLQITLTTGTVYADYVSGTGTNALTFRYTVSVSDEDQDGVALVSPLDLNSGTIKDVETNDAILTYTPPAMGSVLVDGVAPTISSITPPANASYKQGDNLDFTANFSENVDIVNSPRIQINLNSGTVYANYQSGTGTSAIVFRYTVGASETDADGIVLISPLDLNATGTVMDPAGNNSALIYTPPATASILVDSTVPTISSITPPANTTYKFGNNLDFTVNLSENVNVTGTPRIQIILTSGTVYADYVSGTGTGAHIYRYIVGATDVDLDGILTISPLDLNAGTLRDDALNDTTLTFAPPATGSILVDGSSPTISSITPPANTTYKLGDNLDFTANFSENVNITGTPRIQITLTTGTVYADYDSGTGTSAIVFRYTVGASDEDLNGVVLLSPMELNSGTIRDGATNDAVLTFTPPATSSINVDGVVSTISSVTAPANSTYKQGDNLDFTVNFSENVDITGSPRIQINLNSGTVYATYNSGTGSSAIIFRYTVGASETDADGIVLISPLELNSGTVKDSTAGNDSALIFTAPGTSSILVDTTLPTISSITPPANNDYKQGDNLDFTANFSENVDITGSPRIQITLTSGTVYATYQSGTGSSAIVFRYSVGASQTDANGIAVVSPMQLNGGTIRDTALNDATLALTPPATGSINIDTTLPTIGSVTPPANATYKVGNDLDFTVNFSENVDITGTPRIQITLTSGTVYADYQSGTGSSAIVFRYSVTASDVDTNGITLVSPIQLNSGTIRDSALNDATLTFTPPATGSVLVDGVVPTISSITPPANDDYKQGDNLDFTANFSENVNITGNPRIQITLTSGTVYATYNSGTGSSAIVFRYTVGASETDANGITLVSPMQLNSGTIRDGGLNDATLTYTPPATGSILVDTTVPTISSVSPPADSNYTTAQNLDFTVNFSESVNITGSPRIQITLDSGTAYATYQSGTGSTAIVFRYSAGGGDNDDNGIVLTSPLQLNGGTIRDTALNDSTLTYAPPGTSGIQVNFVATVTLDWSPAPHDYGSPGVDATQTFTLQNNGNVTSGTLTLSIIGGGGKFVIEGPTDTCTGSTLAAAATCTVDVTYQWILPDQADAATLDADDSSVNGTSALTGLKN